MLLEDFFHKHFPAVTVLAQRKSNLSKFSIILVVYMHFTEVLNVLLLPISIYSVRMLKYHINGIPREQIV